MQRRKFLQNSMLSLGALTLGKQSILKAMSVEPWKITMLNDDTGIFTKRGGTSAFHFSTEGITVVDAQFPESARHLVDELKKRKNQPFHLLINTHHHGDHTAGNIVFKDLLNRVLAHKNSLANQKKVAIANKTEDQQLYPNQIFETEWEEYSGKEKINLSYFGPAHTDGDSIIHFTKANIVHMGDLVFNRHHPFVDRSAGANLKSWMNVLNSAVKKFDNKTLYVCGHSGTGYEVTGSKDMLLAFQDYLGNVLKFVEKEIKSGKTKEEILKATEIPGSPEWKTEGIEGPLTAAFEELTA